jgi:hypothetical protein
MVTEVTVRMEATRDAAELERKAAAQAPGYSIGPSVPLRRTPDSALEEAMFVDPVSFTITATVALLAVRMVNHWLKNDEHGVQVDLRTQPATISQLINVPAGVMVVIDREGKAAIHRHAYDKPEDLLPTLTRIFTVSPGTQTPGTQN